MREMGYDLEKAEKTGKFLFVEYSPEKVKMMLDEGGGAIESTVLKNNVSRLVIDSVTSFTMLFDDDSSKRQAVLGLFDIIRKWDMTSLLTVQYDPSDKHDPNLSYLEFEADSITLLYYTAASGTRGRFIEVIKMRGTDHSKDVHVFKIGKGGLSVGPKASVRPKA
jgi:KaiC/GvpD/RAD55 family RecA-like ATPase